MRTYSDEYITMTVNKYISSLYKFCFSYLKNNSEAEDVVQETFLVFISKHPHFANDYQKKAWLFKVASNKCKNLLSSKHRSEVELTENIVGATTLDYEDTCVLKYVLSLDEKYRIPVHLYYYEGYSIKEIAHILGKKPATVGTQLDRARKLLRKILEDKTI